MIKSELVQKIAEKNPHLYHRDIERIVNTVLDEIINALKEGDRVELRGFGAFSAKARNARMGRNPRTGESVEVVAKRVPFFKTGKELRERLNQKAPPAAAKSAAKIGTKTAAAPSADDPAAAAPRSKGGRV